MNLKFYWMLFSTVLLLTWFKCAVWEYPEVVSLRTLQGWSIETTYRCFSRGVSLKPWKYTNPFVSSNHISLSITDHCPWVNATLLIIWGRRKSETIISVWKVRPVFSQGTWKLYRIILLPYLMYLHSAKRSGLISSAYCPRCAVIRYKCLHPLSSVE